MRLEFATARWFSLALENCLTGGKKDFYTAHRDGDRGYIAQRGSNNQGAFMALVEYSRGGRRNCIFIPEERDGKGWRKLIELLKEGGRENRFTGIAPPATTVDAPTRSYRDALQQSRVFVQDQKTDRLGATYDRLKGPVVCSVGAQNRVGDGRGVVGLNKEDLLRALSEVQKQVEDLQLNILSLKRGVEEVEWGGLNLGVRKGPNVELGSSSTQAAQTVQQPIPGFCKPKTIWSRRPDSSGKTCNANPEVRSSEVTPVLQTAPVTQKMPAIVMEQVLPSPEERKTGSSGRVGNPNHEVISSEAAPVIQTAPVSQKNPAILVEQLLPTREEERNVFLFQTIFFPDSTAQNEPIHTLEVSRDLVESPEMLSEDEVERVGDTVEELSPQLTDSPVMHLELISEEGAERTGANIFLESDRNVENNTDGVLAPNSQVPSTLFDGQKAVGTMVEWEGGVQLGGDGSPGVGDPVPLSCLAPTEFEVSDWVFRKIKEIQQVVGMECVGYEEQFLALFTSIEASHFQSKKAGTKKQRELKRLKWSLNEGSSSRDRSKGKGLATPL
ncbi:hypothetical protein I3760_13G030000 [Carya illinoinensis]|nr:hypothetical protein I3760_13G030000 [Carya illinoinensis]